MGTGYRDSHMILPAIIHSTPQMTLSTWPIARAVARAGQLGVVSSAPLAPVLARRLQLGDFDAHLRRALEHFPYPGVARRVWEQFYVPGGKPVDQPFAPVRQPTLESGPALLELIVLANFAEVFLAKEGDAGNVGLHLHDQVQTALLPSLYGALLAGVDYVLVSGRNPAALPAVLDRLLKRQPAELEASVAKAPADATITCGFDPVCLGDVPPPNLVRPRVLAFVESPEQAASVFLRAGGRIDGFLWDCADHRLPSGTGLAHMRALALPFWISGLPARRENHTAARGAGAAGLCVSTPFIFCEESPLATALKHHVLTLVRDNPAALTPHLAASPTGPTVSVLQLEGTAAAPKVMSTRPRFCDVGYLRELYRKPDGTVGYRCPGEPLAHYTHKGGDPAAAQNQICLCNSLLASVGLAQVRSNEEIERALVPAGEDVRELGRFLAAGSTRFTAAEVIAHLVG